MHKDLDLTKNPSSKALLAAGGNELSDFCKKWLQDNNNKPLDEGQFAETDGGKLQCKKVFHLRCHLWKAQNGEQVIYSSYIEYFISIWCYSSHVLT